MNLWKLAKREVDARPSVLSATPEAAIRSALGAKSKEKSPVSCMPIVKVLQSVDPYAGLHLKSP